MTNINETQTAATVTPEAEKRVIPTRPADSASIETWLEYDKEANRSLRSLQAKIDESGSATLLQKRHLRELKAAILDAKRNIRGKRREREEQEAAEAGFTGFNTAGHESHSAVESRLLTIRRFLKSSQLLLAPEERGKNADQVFTEWELGVLDLHDVDQEIHLLYRGRRLYVGSPEKDEELRKKADLIVRLEDDLEGDKKRFEADKQHYSEAELKEKKRSFIEREQRIEGLRKVKEQEMYIHINHYIETLEAKRHEKKLVVVDKMLGEFSTRIENLLAAWQNPPDEYKHNRKKSLTNLGNMRELIQKVTPILAIKNRFLRHKRLLEECQLNDYLDQDLKFLRAFDMEIDGCEMKSNAKMRQLEEKVVAKEAPVVEELEQEYENWVKSVEKIRKDVITVEGDREKVASAIEGVKKLVAARPVDEFNAEDPEVNPDDPQSVLKAKAQDKNARLEMLEKNLQRVREGNISSADFESAYGGAAKNIEKLMAEIRQGDAKDPATREKRQTLKEAFEESKKYFDEISRYKKDLVNMEDQLQRYGKGREQFDQVKAEMDSVDISVKWLTGTDMLRIWDKFSEWAKRRWDRRSDDRIGAVGSKLFDIPGLSVTKSLANEFDKVKESAEIAEVNQYKDALSNKDSWQIEEVMASTRNKDEFKACLIALSENGRLRFDNPRMWKQLEFFQNTIVICENYNDPAAVMWLQDRPMELHDRIHKAIGYCWDFDTYFNWKNQQDNNYDSKKSAWTKRCAQIAETPGGLGKRASELLTVYKNEIKLGRTPKVNPHEYEAIVEFAIKQGKMSPEAKLYFLIQGVACGLLEYPDRLSYFNGDMLNSFPALEIITSDTGRGGNPTREDILNWAKIDGHKNSPGSDFIQWFWTIVSHKPKILQRIDKTLTQGANRMDHDDVVGAAAFGDANTIKKMLDKSMGGEYGLPQTGFMNIPVAYMQYLDNWALNSKYIKDSVIQLKRFISAFSVFYSVTQEDKRMYRNRDFYRFSSHLRHDPNGPRSRDSYSTFADNEKRGVKTVHQFLERVKDMISQLDQPLFDKIFDPDITHGANKNEKLAQSIAWMKDHTGNPKLFGDYDPKNYEELVEQGIPKVLEHLLSGPQGKERIGKLISGVKQDIKSKVGGEKLRNFEQVVSDNQFEEATMDTISADNAQNLPG